MIDFREHNGEFQGFPFMPAEKPEKGKILTRESLKSSGLLEQYVLGLTSREQNRLLEAFLEQNPEAKEDVAALREELNHYLDIQSVDLPEGERQIRTPEDFLDMDHEMILEMTEKNHSLTIWRYALGAVCLLMLALSGYLFRLNENNKSALLEEKARHAQDDNSHRLKVENLEESVLDWSGLQTVTTYVGAGTIQLHYAAEDDQVILDLSHLNLGSLDDREPYHVYIIDGEDSQLALEILPADEHRLHALKVKGRFLQIYSGSKATGKHDSNFLAEISLP